MSLFDGLNSLIGGVANQEASHPAMTGIVDFLKNQPGGVAGLAQKFRENGLGSVVESWISNAPNQPVSAEQVSQVLGSADLGTLAQKVGLDGTQTAELVARFLPGVIDKMSPKGELPAA